MKAIIPIIFSLALLTAYGQNSSLYSSIHPIAWCSAMPDSTGRARCVDSLWNRLLVTHQIPLIASDSVAFLYRGNARSVEWMGDFNGWGYDKSFNSKGELIPGSDIWIFKTSFQMDTRLDYKILINGSDWILDPGNEHQQWSGIGGGSPNSELRMPGWKEDPDLTPRPDIPHGKLKEDILLNSKTLGYQVTYSVYLPSGYEGFHHLPSLYVTDGYEYMHPKLGNMITILDNLLYDRKIKPMVVVFIDHREPVNRSNNKRMNELAMNSKYLDFFSNELIPQVNAQYDIDTAVSTRAIMGSSMGGLTAAYFAFSEPRLFGMAGIQSPSFMARPKIYALCDNPNQPIKVSMTTGLISDASDASRKMKEILQTNACVYHYREVNDGHSWGNWRNLIGDVLIDLFGVK
jgi:enterochelin esterase-like enzyme